MKRVRYPDIFLPTGGKTWFARVVVPETLRPIIGKRQFVRTTGQTDPAAAYGVSRPMAAAWRARIAEARETAIDPAKAEIERLAHRYRETRGGQIALDTLIDVIAFAFEQLGGMTADQRQSRITAAHRNVPALLPGIPGGAAAIGQVTGQPAQSQTRYTAHLALFKAHSRLKDRYLSQVAVEIDAMGKTLGVDIEAVTPSLVQTWVDGQLAAGRVIGTVAHYLNANRSYWRFMQERELIPHSETTPFDRRDMRDNRSPGEKPEQIAGERTVRTCQSVLQDKELRRFRFSSHAGNALADDQQRWTVEQLVTLWQMADAKGLTETAAAIKIAAHTGTQLGEICTLRTSSVQIDPTTGIRFFGIREGESASVPRRVPVHSAISDLIDGLIRNAGTDGYLIGAGGKNKRGEAGGLVGSRFSALKRRLGHPAGLDFHSIRHTVSHEFRRHGVDLLIQKKILGHRDQDVTTGRHAGAAELELAYRAIETLRY
jgi:integrase